LNVFGWPVIQLGLAWAFTRLPITSFKPGPSHGWERGGRFYERVFGIRAWKDRVPDAARWMPGVFSKRLERDLNPEYLERFIRETWRGELCHWCAIAFAPVFFLWNPLWADLVMVTYAIAANLPCVLVQRYTRIRFRRLLARQR
jgi:glycosyl-4,4'-diaponeurosporenoate acyltransferase